MSLQYSALAGADVLQCSHGIGSRFARRGPAGAYEDVTRTLELDTFIFEFWEY